MKEDKLLPCECGNTAYIQPVMGGPYFCVGCPICGQEDTIKMFSTAQLATEYWNTRKKV